MTDEVYAPPQADLLVDTDEANPGFYVVAKKKLAVLYLATVGIYAVYWFYVNWRNFKTVSGEKLIPILRAIFYVFFTHSLFKKVDENLKERELEYDWSPGALATGFVIFTVASNVMDKMAQREIGSPLTDILSLVSLPFILFFLLKAQDAINLSQDDPTGSTNSRFTIYNILWIIFGALIWMLITVGMLDMFGLITL